MLRVGVLVSGGGTNLQAILDAVDSGKITNAKVEVVISNNADAYALERAKKHGVAAECVSPKDFASRDEFNEALLAKVDSYFCILRSPLPESSQGIQPERSDPVHKNPLLQAEPH